MTNTIDVLLILLLIAAIFAVVRVFIVLGDVQKTLANLESTRTEITGTLHRLETVAETTQQIMRDEVVPKLKVARETLVNVEITTRALAETTQMARRLVGKVEGAEKLFSLGGPVAQFVVKKVSGATGGFLSGVSAGIRAVMGRGKRSEPPRKQIGASDGGAVSGALSDTPRTNPVLPASSADKKKISAGSRAKK